MSREGEDDAMTERLGDAGMRGHGDAETKPSPFLPLSPSPRQALMPRLFVQALGIVWQAATVGAQEGSRGHVQEI